MTDLDMLVFELLTTGFDVARIGIDGDRLADALAVFDETGL